MCLRFLMLASLLLTMTGATAWGQGLTGEWSSGTGGSFTSSAGDVDVSVSAVAPSGASVEFETGTMDDVGSLPPGNIYSAPGVSGAAALTAVFAIPSDNDGDEAFGTLSFTFSEPVTDPVLNISRLGGNESVLLGVLGYSSNTARFEVPDSSTYIVRLGGTDDSSDGLNGADDHFVTDEKLGFIFRDPGVSVAATTDVAANGTAAGHVRFVGTFETLTVNWRRIGPEGTGTDIVNFALEIPDVNICGDAELELGEECDDGNDDDSDSCSNTCEFQQPASCPCEREGVFAGASRSSTERIGGPGGVSAQERTCPIGQVAVGMNFDISLALGRAFAAEVICARLIESPTGVNVEETVVRRIAGSGNASYTPANETSARCSEGYVLTGLTVMAPDVDNITFSSPSITCSPLLATETATETIPVSGSWASDDSDSMESASCPVGTAASGLRGIVGAGLDSVQLRCAPALARCATVCGDDADGDGVPDELEDDLGTDSGDSDSDDDGLSDGEEIGGDGFYDPGVDTDPTLADTDGDGVQDGTELGRTDSDPDLPDGTGEGFQPDLDPTTTTDPVSADTDGDGYCDGDPGGSSSLAACPLGNEDTNNDGAVDTGESDPTDPCDPDPDATACDGTGTGEDSDNDGVPDDLEDDLGTDPDDPDSDNDGLNDGEEVGDDNTYDEGTDTDPNNPDTDEDGINDGDEVENGTDPLDPDDPGVDPNTDTDEDGIPDVIEDDLGTDPNDPDTDGDGLEDGEEVGDDNTYDEGVDTDPNNDDTDSDGIEDGDEVENGTDPLDPDDPGQPEDLDSDDDGLNDDVEDDLGTNPFDPDSDDDGIDDGDEVGNGTDPLDPLDPNNPNPGGQPVNNGVDLGLSGGGAPANCSTGGSPAGGASMAALLALGLAAARRRRE